MVSPFSFNYSSNTDFYFQALPDDLNVLSDINCESLIRALSKDEVFRTLKSMPRDKSPDPDGLNTKFYLFYWNQIGDHLFNVVSYFFNFGSLPISWGKTYVALIPKKPNPTSVTDFRSISLCNVCYKLISKILANRLKWLFITLLGLSRMSLFLGVVLLTTLSQPRKLLIA